MKNPGFYCINYIECNSNIPMYQPRDCDEQCDDCLNAIIKHHAKKAAKTKSNEPEFITERAGEAD